MKSRVAKIGSAKIAALVGLGLAVWLGMMGSGEQAQANVPSGSSSASNLYRGYVGKVEERVLEETANGKSTQFLVLLSQQADLSQAYSIHDQDQRGWFVYNSLRSTADQAQAPLKQSLDATGTPYKSYWAANMLLVHGDRS